MLHVLIDVERLWVRCLTRPPSLMYVIVRDKLVSLLEVQPCYNLEKGCRALAWEAYVAFLDHAKRKDFILCDGK